MRGAAPRARRSSSEAASRSARGRGRSLGGALALAALTSACGPSVDCELLCQRTLACEVTFGAPDDPDEALVASGDRTELESCPFGCQASPLVSVDTASCVDEVDTRDASVCQEQVLTCLNADG